MTYYGVVLLMSGYQADEKHIVSQYKGIVQRWVLLLLCLVEHDLTVSYQSVRAISKGFSVDTQQGGRVPSLHIIRLTLPQAKIQRMTSDIEGAIATLKEGLQTDRQMFPQADTLVRMRHPGIYALK